MTLKPRVYEQEMRDNFERKISNLRSQLINTTNPAAMTHIRSSIAILEVELASWK